MKEWDGQKMALECGSAWSRKGLPEKNVNGENDEFDKMSRCPIKSEEKNIPGIKEAFKMEKNRVVMVWANKNADFALLIKNWICLAVRESITMPLSTHIFFIRIDAVSSDWFVCWGKIGLGHFLNNNKP